MEILPPSFTGDPNSARCDEIVFRNSFFCMNAALLYHKLGLEKHITCRHTYSADYIIAVAEEKRAVWAEAKGKPVKSRRDQIGEFMHRRTVRWQAERMAQNM
jgi:hypothetical protein